VLFTSTHYPANYGFIPRTYANDKDPLDVLVLCSEIIRPMTIVECKPIGVLIMEDDGARMRKSLQCRLMTRITAFTPISTTAATQI
jgi:inorganic pyrophosphatase